MHSLLDALSCICFLMVPWWWWETTRSLCIISYLWDVRLPRQGAENQYCIYTPLYWRHFLTCCDAHYIWRILRFQTLVLCYSSTRGRQFTWNHDGLLLSSYSGQVNIQSAAFALQIKLCSSQEQTELIWITPLLPSCPLWFNSTPIIWSLD